MGDWKQTYLLCGVLVATSIGVGSAWSQPRTPQTAQSSRSSGSAARAARQALATRIEALIADTGPKLDGARIGIYVADSATGQTVYQRDAAQPFSIASVTKVITMAAAVRELGPDYRYQTALLAEEIDADGVIPGDLYLRSRGDPTLDAADLDALISDLKRRGVTRIGGRLIIDGGEFDRATSPPHFDEQPDEQAAFRAPVGAANLERNAFTVMVRAAPEPDQPATVWLEPESRYLVLDSAEVTTKPRGRDQVSIDNRRQGDRLRVSVSGEVRAGRGLMRLRQRVDDPLLYIGETLRRRLRESGLRIRKPARLGAVAPDAEVIAQVDSEPLNVLIHALGKRSDNFVAEVLLKTLAAERGSRAQAARAQGRPVEASWAEGVDVVEGLLRAQVGLRARSFRYSNGSGLFDATAFTPAQVGAVLMWAARDPYVGPELMAALAIAGTDGTLARRLDESPARGRVRAKTGTLAQVSALAGYALAPARPPLAFVIFINDHPRRWRSRQAARDLQDGVAEALVAYLDGQL